MRVIDILQYAMIVWIIVPLLYEMVVFSIPLLLEFAFKVINTIWSFDEVKRLNDIVTISYLYSRNLEEDKKEGFVEISHKQYIVEQEEEKLTIDGIELDRRENLSEQLIKMLDSFRRDVFLGESYILFVRLILSKIEEVETRIIMAENMLDVCGTIHAIGKE